MLNPSVRHSQKVSRGRADIVNRTEGREPGPRTAAVEEGRPIVTIERGDLRTGPGCEGDPFEDDVDVSRCPRSVQEREPGTTVGVAGAGAPPQENQGDDECQRDRKQDPDSWRRRPQRRRFGDDDVA
jgi:hypothetical protein